MRLYDDDFAATVSRTLRASHPDALTRSVSALAAPSFAAAMMGRHVLGVMPVERGSLLFTVVDVAGHPQLEGYSVHQAFREHEWRVLAVVAGRRARTGVVDGHPGRLPAHRDARPGLAAVPRAGAAGRGPGGSGHHPAGARLPPDGGPAAPSGAPLSGSDRA
ncbi:hypothetical protein [Streptomyces sp. NPDC003943]